MNRSLFIARIRHSVFGGRLGRSQVDGLTKILDYHDEHYPDLSNPQFAYMLATAAWETGRAMRPVREGGGERYLRRKPYYPWVGEGLVQVTWERNARKFGAEKPGDCMSWPVALRALFDGMIEGVFTGKKLSDFINAERCDFENARRIVNGRDRARPIAAIARNFYDALEAADADEDEDTQNDALVTGKSLLESRTVAAASSAAMAGAAGVMNSAMDALDTAQELHAQAKGVAVSARAAASAWDLNIGAAAWIGAAVIIVIALGVIIHERRRHAHEFGI